MTEINKGIKKEVLKFVKLQDLTSEDLKNVKEIKVVLRDIYFKKNNSHSYVMEFQLHEQLPCQIKITVDRYNFLRLKLNLPLRDHNEYAISEYSLIAKVRFIKGETENGEYKSVELVFAQYVYHIYWLTKVKDQREVLKILEDRKMLVINWTVRPDKISESEMESFDFNI